MEMYIINTLKITTYTTKTGKTPFLAWQNALDVKARAIVRTRLARVSWGNFGDCKLLKNGEGVWELRIDFGPGYRIYFGKKGATVVVLLVGGDKGSQERDIAKAKKYWLECKEVLHG